MENMVIRAAQLFLLTLLLGFTLALPGSPAVAQSATENIRFPNPSGLPIPRWVSTRKNEVNMRTGPGVRYPIDWVLQLQYLPVEVVGEFENWRKVSTHDKTAGWVHKSMLSGNRMASVAVARAHVMKQPSSDASIAAYVEEGVVVSLDGCDPDWCRVAIASHSVEGWIPRAALWGLHPGEVVER